MIDLGSISLMGRAVFLLIFAAVNLAGWRLAEDRTATPGGRPRRRRLRRLPRALLVYAATTDPLLLAFLAGMIALAAAIQAGYQNRRTSTAPEDRAPGSPTDQTARMERPG